MSSPPCVSLVCTSASKLCTAQAIKGIYAEALRQPMPSGRKYTENVDPRRSQHNFIWHNPRWKSETSDIPDYMKAINTLMQERAPGKKIKKLRKDAVLVRSPIYQVSPAFFFPRLENWSQRDIELSHFEERGHLDMDRVNAWKDIMISYLERKYGDALLSIELHLDETSPHLHVQLVPVTVDGRLCSKELFNVKSIKQQLDELAEACAPLGIVRAREGGREGRTPQPPGSEWETFRERERAKDLENARLAQETGDRKYMQITSLPEDFRLPPMPEQPEEPKKPGILGFFANSEEQENYEREFEEYQEKLKKYEQESSPTYRQAQQKKQILEYLNKQEKEKTLLQQDLDKTKYELNKQKYENEKLRKKIEAANLREIPLADVMARMYPDMFFQDKHDKSTYRTTDDRKIKITNQKFIDNHDTNFKGYGAIDFIMRLENCEVSEAIGKLRDYFGKDETTAHIMTAEKKFVANIVKIAQSSPEPEAPTPAPQKIDALKKWMIQELCLTERTTDFLIDTNQVYADYRENCIIPRPNGGHFARGTVKLKSGEPNKFKQTYGSKKAGAAHIHGPKATPETPAILCEGITDALALIDIYSNANIYITGGNLYPDLPELTGEIYLAFDNDEAGKAHTAHYRAIYPKAKELPPPGGNDWSQWHKQQQQTAQTQNTELEQAEDEEENNAPRPGA